LNKNTRRHTVAKGMLTMFLKNHLKISYSSLEAAWWRRQQS